MGDQVSKKVPYRFPSSVIRVALMFVINHSVCVLQCALPLIICSEEEQILPWFLLYFDHVPVFYGVMYCQIKEMSNFHHHVPCGS